MENNEGGQQGQGQQEGQEGQEGQGGQQGQFSGNNLFSGSGQQGGQEGGGESGGQQGGQEGGQQNQGNEQFNLSNLLNDDLSFKEGWVDQLANHLGDKDKRSFTIKSSKNLQFIKNLPDLINVMETAQSSVGSDKAVIPKEGSPPEVIEQYYRNIGKPESADKYENKDSNGNQLPEEQFKQFSEFAFEKNFTQSQFQELIAFRDRENAEILKRHEDAAESEAIETFNNLTKEWGAAYTDNHKKIQSFLDNTGLSEFVDKPIVLGRNEGFLKLLHSEIISKLSEDDTLLGLKTPISPVDADSRIKEIYNDPTHPFHKNDPDAIKLVDNLAKLRRKQQKVG